MANVHQFYEQRTQFRFFFENVAMIETVLDELGRASRSRKS
jgi:hypothetical protein